MRAGRIVCPSCTKTFALTKAIQKDQFIDCPRCRLMFTPTPQDALAVKPSASPYPNRRRRSVRKSRPNRTAAIVVITVVVILASVMAGIAIVYFASKSPPPTVAPAPHVSPEPRDVSPKSSDPEIEDDRPPPHKQAPRIDGESP